jgi:DNA-binding NarL/FixJ family response regulator
MIRALLADDQELVREGLRMMLDAEPDISVVGEAGTGRQVLARTSELDPDIVLMDLRMPDLDGIETTDRLVRSGARARVLVLTTFDLDEYVYRAMRAGAGGFLLKDARREQLIEAVRVVLAGETILAPSITRRLVEDYCRRPPPAGPNSSSGQLSARELEVVRELAIGRSNSEIAAALFLGEATVKSHIAHILSKLELRDRVQIVIYAYEHGIVGR